MFHKKSIQHDCKNVKGPWAKKIRHSFYLRKVAKNVRDAITRDEKIPSARSTSRLEADCETFSEIVLISSHNVKCDCAINSWARRVSPARIADIICAWFGFIDAVDNKKLLKIVRTTKHAHSKKRCWLMGL